MSLDEEPGDAADENAYDEDEDLSEAEPRSRWSTASDITSGLLALLVVSAGVWLAYLAFGVGFALLDRALATAAPAIGVLCAALLLARYLSRR